MTCADYFRLSLATQADLAVFVKLGECLYASRGVL